MSTYKSLGGPAGGLLLTNRADLAERIDAIAYPGLTANFDAGKTAALAITMLDWLDGGHDYAAAMTTTAAALADALAAARHARVLDRAGLHDVASVRGRCSTNGAAATRPRSRLRDANILACAIGLARRRRVVRTATRHTRDRPLGHDR